MKTYTEIAGDGGSGVVKQIIAQQKEIDSRLAKVKHLIAVGSGKGGVGKSSLAVQLALSLQGEGKKVGILDLDFNGPSIARICGLRDAILIPGKDGLLPPKTSDGISVLSLGTCLSEDQYLSFASVSANQTHTWRQTREFASLAGLLAGTDWGELDALIIDLPPGPERTVQFMEFFGARLNLVLVTLPSDLSAGVVLRGLKAVENLPGRVLGYIENMKGYLDSQTGEIKELFPESIEVSIDTENLGALPFEPGLASLCDSGISYEQWSELQLSSGVKTIASRICTLLSAEKIKAVNGV